MSEELKRGKKTYGLKFSLCTSQQLIWLHLSGGYFDTPNILQILSLSQFFCHCHKIFDCFTLFQHKANTKPPMIEE